MELISREEMINQMNKDVLELREKARKLNNGKGFIQANDCYNAATALEIYASLISKIPTIESRPQGEWKERIIEISKVCVHKIYNCSVCGEEAFFDEDGDRLTNYCPHCGADMRGGE